MVGGIGPRGPERGAYMARVLDSTTLDAHHHFREQLRRIGSFEAMHASGDLEKRTLFEQARGSLQVMQENKLFASNPKIAQMLSQLQDNIDDIENSQDDQERYEAAVRKTEEDHRALEQNINQLF